MKKKLKDFTEEEIQRICDNNLCDKCPFSHIRQGCGSLVDYPEEEIEVPEAGEAKDQLGHLNAEKNTYELQKQKDFDELVRVAESYNKKYGPSKVLIIIEEDTIQFFEYPQPNSQKRSEVKG